jgi:solute carrier family 25 phosphate transporter 3
MPSIWSYLGLRVVIIASAAVFGHVSSFSIKQNVASLQSMQSQTYTRSIKSHNADVGLIHQHSRRAFSPGHDRFRRAMGDIDMCQLQHRHSRQNAATRRSSSSRDLSSIESQSSNNSTDGQVDRLHVSVSDELLLQSSDSETTQIHDEVATVDDTESTVPVTDEEMTIKKAKKRERTRAKRKAVLTTTITTTSLVAGIYALMALSGPGSWRYYLAGGLCASTSHAITTPIDVLKTRQQVLYQQTQLLDHQDGDDSGSGGNAATTAAAQTPNLLQAGISVLKQPDGVSQLLAGLGPTTVGYLFEGAAKFGVYEVLKPVAQSLITNNIAGGSSNISPIHRIIVFSVCATISGIVASLMLCPMEAIRIRIVAKDSDERSGNSSESDSDTTDKSSKKTGWVYDGLRMLRKEGFSGMYKGLNAMMAKQVPYTVTKQVSFDIGATMFYKYVKAVLSPATFVAYSRSILFAIPLLSAALASVLSCISSQPGDMLLSLVNANAGDKRTRDFAREIYEESGIQGFFVGIKVRFLHVGLIVTVQLLIYDMVKRMCGIAATGSA